ncbi:MAG: hypothetical protein AAGE89_14955 [Pseudomonadota bacterium]
MSFVKRLIAGILLLLPTHAFAAERVAIEHIGCETYTVGETGHSEQCPGPAGRALVIHDRRDRVDVEILEDGQTRGTDVLRLSGHLGPGRRDLNREESFWWTSKAKNPEALILSFLVEPRPYEESLPFTLVFRVDGTTACVVAKLHEGSTRTLDDVFGAFGDLKCRQSFGE